MKQKMLPCLLTSCSAVFGGCGALDCVWKNPKRPYSHYCHIKSWMTKSTPSPPHPPSLNSQCFLHLSHENMVKHVRLCPGVLLCRRWCSNRAPPSWAWRRTRPQWSATWGSPSRTPAPRPPSSALTSRTTSFTCPRVSRCCVWRKPPQNGYVPGGF